MCPELGLYALIWAACFALVQTFIGVMGVYRNNAGLLRATRSAAFCQCGFATISFLLLAWAFVSNDFSVAYVAENSNAHLPYIYRFCAVWGAHEGSMLLWVFILSIWTGLVAYQGRTLPAEMLARVLVVMGCIALGFYLFILETSNPFLRLLPNSPIDGRDLNALLQDPGLVSHPPLLYVGYVGMVVPFAFALAGLWQGHFDARWAAWTRPWTTLAWSALTCGIVLGSWWAYRELGWGGWWFWDPVENASFLPWLAATALIHSLMVSEKRNQFKSWTVLLAISAFSLSLIGTFLVRSGVLISVHTFASDPARGAFILKFLLVVLGISWLLYAWRGQRLVQQGMFSIWSRESFLLANNMLLFVALLTVLLGTVYPLLIDVLRWGKISVGAPYFNTVFVPLMIPLLFLMGIAPSLYWGRSASALHLLRPMLIMSIISVCSAGLVVLFFPAHSSTKMGLWIGLFLAFWLGLTTSYYLFRMRPKIEYRRCAVVVAHWGMAVCVIGIVLSHAYSDERNLRMRIGEQATLGSYVFQLKKIYPITGPNYHAMRAEIPITQAERGVVAILYPEYRGYDVSGMALSKTDIVVRGCNDLYVALGSEYKDHSWSIRIYLKPFVRWIWIGGLMMAAGGLLAVVL